MIAKVHAIHSGASYSDGRRRISLWFDDGEMFYREIKLNEDQLGPGASLLALDDVVEVTFTLRGVAVLKTEQRPEPATTIRGRGK